MCTHVQVHVYTHVYMHVHMHTCFTQSRSRARQAKAEKELIRDPWVVSSPAEPGAVTSASSRLWVGIEYQ